jgi:GH24 family phage-related lysozyme (muramidase)
MTTKKKEKSKRTGREIVVAKPIRFSMPSQPYMKRTKRNPARWVIAYTALLALIILAAVGGTFYFTYRPAATVPYLPILTVTPTLIQEATSDPSPTPTGPPPADKVSKEGKLFIMALEGLMISPYEDAGGRCTVGYGHLLNDGPCAGFGQISMAKALDYFDHDISNVEDILQDDLDGVNLNQCQYDAIASFVYNVGPWTWRMSSVIVSLRLDNLVDVSYELLGYVYINGGTPLHSLEARRKAEGRLFDECRYRGS